MSGQVTRIDAKELKARLHDGGEIALLDAREELPFGRRHLLMASCVPLSRLELLVDDLVPRRATRVVWCDDDEGLAARAAARMAALGYQDVALLDGGIAAWEAAGFRVYSGVHVPSKAFAEVVEHEAATPWISAEELKALIDRKADIAIYDSRSYEEYHNNSIPTAVSVPGAELVYRFADLMPSSATTVIVNCGGRTRSIIGAQSLINAGVANKVVSLKDGTMAWHLADFGVVHGATRRPPDVTPCRAAGGAAARGTRGSAPRHRAHRQAHARHLARRSGRAQPLRARRAHAGRIRGRPPARRAAGAGRTARAGNRQPHGDLGRARRAGGRQRRPRDHDRIVVEADGLARRRGSRLRSWGRRLDDRAARATRPRPGGRRRTRHRCNRPARPVGRRRRGRDRSRPEPAPCAGPYSRLLVRDPRAAARWTGEAARRSDPSC